VEGESKPTSSLSNMLRASERATYPDHLTNSFQEFNREEKDFRKKEYTVTYK
jgi:hypothetical protein